MARYGRDEVACHLCFNDKMLQEWIKQEATKRGSCPWCGRKGRLVPLEVLGGPFREVVDDLYVSVDGSEFDGGGDQIGFLLGDDWHIFAQEIEDQNLAQELAVSILQAGLRPKALDDHPDYEGLFRHHRFSLEDSWDGRVYAVLNGGLTRGEDISVSSIKSVADVPDQMEVVFEDLATKCDQGEVLCRARIHEDRTRVERFGAHDLGAPPPELTPAGRTN